MKNKVRILLVLVLLFSLLVLPLQSYMVNAISGEDLFFNIEKLSVSKNEQIVMKINLSKIEYENFNFKLTSNVSLQNVDVNNEESVENLNQNNNELSFDFNKESSSINTIVLNYNVSEELNVGDSITFKAVVTSSNEEDAVLELTYNVEIVEEQAEQTEPTNPSGPSNPSGQTESTQPSEPTQPSQPSQPTEPSKPSSGTKPTSSSGSNMPSKSGTGSFSASGASRSVITYVVSGSYSTPKETVVYKGSDNNYLKSLSVSGYKLNKDFKKESLTYFISVDESVNSLTVNAASEDSDSKVYINGNTNLKSGTNKILITVVAENGNTKVYRIYVKRA